MSAPVSVDFGHRQHAAAWLEPVRSLVLPDWPGGSVPVGSTCLVDGAPFRVADVAWHDDAYTALALVVVPDVPGDTSTVAPDEDAP